MLEGHLSYPHTPYLSQKAEIIQSKICHLCTPSSFAFVDNKQIVQTYIKGLAEVNFTPKI
jgi:hypothetical protein